MAQHSPRQRAKVATVMRAYKQHKLHSGGGETVDSPRQAIAIALREADVPARNAAARQSPRGNAAPRQARAQPAGEDAAPSYTALLKQARAANIPGRSRMSRDQLIRALRRH